MSDSPYERCPTCGRKYHYEEMINDQILGRVCYKCPDDIKIIKEKLGVVRSD